MEPICRDTSEQLPDGALGRLFATDAGPQTQQHPQYALLVTFCQDRLAPSPAQCTWPLTAMEGVLLPVRFMQSCAFRT